MRIALFHNLPSGGAKRTVAEECRRLSLRHEVDAYTLSSANHEFSDIRSAVAAHHAVAFRSLPLFGSPFGRMNQALRTADLVRLDAVARGVAKTIDAKGYDVVLVHPCRFEQAPSLLAHLRTPAVYYCHEPPRLLYETMPERPYDDDASPRRRLLNRLDPLPGVYRRALRARDRRNTRRADRVLVNSRFTADAVSRIYGVTAEVSYHGVDVQSFRPLGIERRPFVLSVGSLTPLKGFDFLIRALGEYPAASRPALVIASNFQTGPEYDYLMPLAQAAGVELVLRGCVTEEDLLRLYNEARLVVYAPIREPFGLVPLEAMACGTPVVAVAEGGVPESVVDGKTGLLAARDPAAFAAAVRRLMEDTDLAERFGRNGRELAMQRWSWERAVSDLEHQLAAAVSARQRLTSVA